MTALRGVLYDLRTKTGNPLSVLPEPSHRRNYQSYGLRDDRRFGDKLKALRHWLKTSYVNEVISRSRSNLIHRVGSDTQAS
ncbi:hypothetical protein ALC56_09372 [Trachymyrmex septentrionalis]|uniref:Uncharacterized protein n=1 Tax=Trachymyrmex septentrionalis TaxID=34720 RepID=A0A195F896_9HYME|nr:hypothetical protein ALC56_09372 [Trachymyrmex septentrionalis]